MIKNTAFTLTESLIGENNIICNNKPYLIDLQSIGTQTHISNQDFLVKCYTSKAMSNSEFVSLFFQPKQGTEANIQTRMTILNRARMKNGKDKSSKAKANHTKPFDFNITKPKDQEEKKAVAKGINPSTPIEVFKMSNGSKGKQLFCINTDDQGKNGTK